MSTVSRMCQIESEVLFEYVSMSSFTVVSKSQTLTLNFEVEKYNKIIQK